MGFFCAEAPVHKHQFVSALRTAKANEIEPQAYLKFLFERFLAAQSTEDMRALMPQRVDRSLLPSLPKPKPRKK